MTKNEKRKLENDKWKTRNEKKNVICSNKKKTKNEIENLQTKNLKMKIKYRKSINENEKGKIAVPMSEWVNK